MMFDFRNHGESGFDPNKGMSGIGLEEYKEVVAAMNYIKGRDDVKEMDVGFVSYCMGANSTIIAMSSEPSAFKKVKYLFAVQPISMKASLKVNIKRILKSMGVKLILPMIEKFIIRRGAHSLENMSPKEYAKDLNIPTMYG